MPDRTGYVDPNAQTGPNRLVSQATLAQARLDRAAVERVEALHVEDSEGWCASDGFGWPCSTIRALRGES
jgi:hypothetical protein